MKYMVNLHNSCNEGVDASDDLFLHSYEPKAHDLYETTGRALRSAPELAGAPLQQILYCGPRLR